MTTKRETTGLEVAVIGMAGRFPGAPDVDSLWTLLRDGIEPIAEFSDADIAAAGNLALSARAEFVRKGFVLDDIDLFDAAFFGYTPREAEMLDPQQRFFLECASEALERAGCDPEAYRGAIGVFAGSSMSSYLLHNILSDPDIMRRLGATQLTLANDKDYLATRVAYRLNLEGPAVTVQTACSTSLVAVHLACQSLLAGECDMALAGGVSIPARQRAGYLYQEGGIASRDGHCRPFDADASGTTGGNGCGIVVLKRLADALEDRDSIDAVIIGSAINNDGSRKIGFTAPRVEGQAKVILAAQRVAGVVPEDISYIEAHGTGTPLGDPIEIAALTRVFGEGSGGQSCAIGSIKSNFGHADAAAGVAGLMKTVLALKHRMLPPSLHFERPNPKIDFKNSPFYVNTALQEWTPTGAPRRAGVSSFGLGGTNAHAVLEQAPARAPAEASRKPRLIVLSARTATALDSASRRLAEHLRAHPELRLDDVACTLQLGRRSFEHRRALVCDDLMDAAKTLEAVDPGRVFDGVADAAERNVVFMFSGQGAQYPGMTRDLYRDHEMFRKDIDDCCERLKSHLNLDLRPLLYPEEADLEQAAENLKQTAIAQSALFVVEYALARWWMSLGIKPAAMIGHSIGEYVAACIAGVFTLDEALALVAARARLMQAQARGAMLSVSLSHAEFEPLLGDSLEIAVVNAARACVASGPVEAIAALEQRLSAAGHACRRLHTSHAFHSAMMEPMLAEFAREFAKARPKPPQIPYISNLSGTWITGEQATDAAYWSRHLRHTVQFAAGVETALRDANACFLEIGPGNTLCSLVRQHPACGAERLILASVRHPHQRENDTRFILDALGRLWSSGKRIDWPKLHGDSAGYRVPLPTYPFERQRYWIESAAKSMGDADAPRDADLLESRDGASRFHVRSWRRQPAPAALAPAVVPGHDWLVFADDGGLGECLAERLRGMGHGVLVIRAGSEFRHGADRCTIRAAEPSHYENLFRAQQEAGRFPRGIVHLWAVGPAAGNGGGASAEPLDRCFFSFLHIAQALGKMGQRQPVSLIAVSDGMQLVTGEETILPEKATLLGPCHVIPQEYPNVACRSIDLGRYEPERAQAVVDALIAELGEGADGTVAAYRGGFRWTPHVEALRLPAQLGPSPLRKEGVYLITGGLGGIGFALAEHLAATYAARLVLVGRTELPARERWDEWLAAHSPNDPTSRKLERLRKLEARGAMVMTVQADVASRVQMQDVVDRARARFGVIHGVMHAAGVAAGGAIQLKTRASAAAVLAPKIQGAQVLDEIFHDAPLDFMLLCSSLTALSGAPGQVDYTAANAFLDALAHGRSARGRHTVSVNWDTWGETGMALETEVPDALVEQRRKQLARGLRTDEGIEAFERLLRCRLPQVLVVSGHGATGAAGAKSAETPHHDPAGSAATTHVRPRALTQAYIAPRNPLEEQLAGIWSELFGIERIGVHDQFFDLGGHSLMALQIVARIRERLDLELSLARFLELGTIEKLALHIDALSWIARGNKPEPDAAVEDRDEISL